jgi:replicative DNA helicase
MSIRAASAKFRQGLAELRANPTKPRGLASGIPGLDQKLSFGPGDLVTVMARTSVGKTSVLLEFIQAACEQLMANKSDQAVAVISADMPAERLVQRLVASNLNVSPAGLFKVDEPVLNECLNYIESWPLHIMNQRGPELQEVQSWLHNAGCEVGGQAPFGLIVVDHLGKINVPGSGIYDRTSEVSRQLQKMASDWDTCVVLAAQAKREVENRISRDPRTGEVDVSMTRPLPSDIEGSGKVEQDSTAVLCLWREERYKAMTEQREEKPGPLEINVAKNQNGPTGFVKVDFIPELTKLQGTTRFYMPPASAAALKTARRGVLTAALKGAGVAPSLTESAA